MEPPSPSDEAIVARQIGRRPRGLRAVEARCAFGHPTVVSVRPFVGRRGDREGTEPFPTLFWLTCPVLVEQISRLEAAGGVRAMEAAMEADPALAAAVAADHRRYAAERWEAMDPAERARAAESGVEGILRDTGIGGLRDLRFVKCLHAHAGFHLARGGAVGALLRERHGFEQCAPGAVRCDAFGVKPGADGERISRDVRIAASPASEEAPWPRSSAGAAPDPPPPTPASSAGGTSRGRGSSTPGPAP